MEMFTSHYLFTSSSILENLNNILPDKKTKEYQLGQETHFIDYELTGNELVALLVQLPVEDSTYDLHKLK